MKLRFQNQSELISFINSDDAIFHFTKKATAIEYILYDIELKFGDFKKSNDPQEYSNRVTSAAGWGWKEEHRTKIDEASWLIDEIVKSSGFLSFCQNKFRNGELEENGCLKSRMWSQYGDDQSGICLVFSKSKLLKSIKRQVSSDFTVFHENVVYSDPQKGSIDDNLYVDGSELAEKEPEEIAKRHIFQVYKEIFFHKQPDYGDENEFRIVLLPKLKKPGNGLFIDISSCLKAIILGDKFPNVYLPTIKELSKNLNIACRKLHWEHLEYYLRECK